MFVRLILIAGSFSAIAGYAACFILRELISQAAWTGENWFWIVLLGVGVLGATLFTEYVLKISNAVEERPVTHVVITAAATWLPYALLVSVFAPQVFGFTELSFFLSPLVMLGGCGLIVYQVTDELFPQKQMQRQEQLKKFLRISVTTEIYRLVSRILLIILLISVFSIATIVVSLLGFLYPDIFSEEKTILAIELLAGLLLGGGVLGYSVWRLSKRARPICRIDAQYKRLWR